MTEGEEQLRQRVADLVKLFDVDKRHEFKIFMMGIVNFISEHPSLIDNDDRVVHSFKFRLKDPDHLDKKVIRKIREGKDLNEGNFFSLVTDLAGVRILHLFQEDFGRIDSVIRKRVNDGDWWLGERPRAYTWDPEAASFFQKFDLDVEEKSTAYTSVHYLVRPKQNSPICCEIQVRTLFEEIWGEVDHRLNYPIPSESMACREQLRVLSKITGAGSRLLDSLQRVHEAEKKDRQRGVVVING
ncbi:RelA/SpoT domain-containing protein [Rhizobium leguminosarum]|uniref:RelA/SpoT domain-containing protein n=1 Tax=Rhizobium leguminosarum TaxID=384 RepID=UPI00140F6324|nr:RelA/SpoT domain-containing protein [Rhizobium leguminosarum]QIO64799.1 RelA/SpoT domain-containing protein [Rhizobium leguminosarum bv. trifolii]